MKFEFKEEWSRPLVDILNGYERLAKITDDLPTPPPGRVFRRKIPIRHDPSLVMAPSAIVAIVVCVAVAARPGAVISDKLLERGLLDVYGPEERKALREVIGLVKQNPDLVRNTLGMDAKALGRDFMGRLERVERVLG